MKKALSVILAFSILISTGILTVFAEESPEGAVVQDNLVTTTHKTVIQGKTVNYTATAGTMAVESGGGQCEIFFIAYTRDGVQDLSKRPITFAFNGGPGAASLYINFLCLGPKRMELDELGHAPALPAALVYNGNSLLDLTDLVFIDAVGTGYSRAVSEEDQFIGYTNDIRTIGDFIRLYVNRNGRWGSPKYLAGESYGTTRNAGVCDCLHSRFSIDVNGIIMISTANDFGALVQTPGNEMPYIHYIPSFAAAAWYHKKADEKYLAMTLEDVLEEAKAFASGEYLSALYLGNRLTAEQKDAVAEKMAGIIGMSKDDILELNLRVSMEDYCAGLLKDEGKMIGRYDARYTGPVLQGDIGSGENDPSNLGIEPAFNSAFCDYISRTLGFTADRHYEVLSGEVNGAWNFGTDNAALTQEDQLRTCMSDNEMLRIWVICGYYDLATPFYGAEWVYSHVFIDDNLRGNLTFSHFPSGHMFYLVKDALKDFHAQAEAWYGATTAGK